MNYSVCILAAGKGSRTQLDFNKVFFKFSDGTSVLDRSINLFNEDPDCKEIILVVAKHEQEYVEKLYQNLDKDRRKNSSGKCFSWVKIGLQRTCIYS